MDSALARLLRGLNRREVSAETKSAFVHLGRRGWDSLLEIAREQRLSDLQRSNAVLLLLQLQLIGVSTEVKTRDQGEFVSQLQQLAVCSKKRLRSAGIKALVVLLRQSEHPGWPIVLPPGTDEIVKVTAKKALELGVDAAAREAVLSWLDGNKSQVRSNR